MTITALPAAPDPTDGQTAFDDAADAWVAALPGFVTEANTLGANLTRLAAGTALAIPYTFSSTTTDADPGAGYLRLDNFAAQTSATVIRCDLVDSAAVTQTAVIDTFDDSTSAIKGFIGLVSLNDASKWLLFSVSSLASPSGYKNITVTNVAGSAAAPFADGDDIVLMFTRNGDKGDTGTAGAAGTSGFTRTARASNTQLTAADFSANTRVEIEATGTFTQTIVAASTITARDYVLYKNAGTGIITIDPDSAELIDGAATINIMPGEACQIICDGSAFYTIGLAQKGALVEITRQSASASATLDCANVFSSAYDVYKVALNKIKPANDSVSLYVRTSTDGGSTYDAGASNYDYAVYGGNSGGGAVNGGSAGATQVVLNTNTIGNDVQEWVSGEIVFAKPLDAAYASMNWSVGFRTNTGVLVSASGSGSRLSAADIDSFRLLFSAGNIASGEVTVYGVKK